MYRLRVRIRSSVSVVSGVVAGVGSAFREGISRPGQVAAVVDVARHAVAVGWVIEVVARHTVVLMICRFVPLVLARDGPRGIVLADYGQQGCIACRAVDFVRPVLGGAVVLRAARLVVVQTVGGALSSSLHPPRQIGIIYRPKIHTAFLTHFFTSPFSAK